MRFPLSFLDEVLYSYKFVACSTFPFVVVFVVAGCIVYVLAVVVSFKVVFCVLCFA
jgi:hypothetical protein